MFSFVKTGYWLLIWELKWGHHYRFYGHKRIVKEYYEKKSISTNLITQMKWTNFSKDNFPKLTQEAIDNLNRANKTEIIGLRWVYRWILPTFKKEIMPTLYNLFQRIEAEVVLLTHCSDQHYPNTKNTQRHYEKKLQSDISHEHKCKNHQQNVSKSNSTPSPSVIYTRYMR